MLGMRKTTKLMMTNVCQPNWKERKKNFVSANVGIIATVILFVYTTIQAFFIYQVTEAIAV